MKKIILLAAIALGITSGCRKERTCECKTSSTEVRTGFGAETTTQNTSTKVTEEKQKKKFFKDHTDCFSKSYSYTDSGGNGPGAWSSVTTVETTCTLN